MRFVFVFFLLLPLQVMSMPAQIKCIPLLDRSEFKEILFDSLSDNNYKTQLIKMTSVPRMFLITFKGLRLLTV